jgi:hypothetical protein
MALEWKNERLRRAVAFPADVIRWTSTIRAAVFGLVAGGTLLIGGMAESGRRLDGGWPSVAYGVAAAYLVVESTVTSFRARSLSRDLLYAPSLMPDALYRGPRLWGAAAAEVAALVGPWLPSSIVAGAAIAATAGLLVRVVRRFALSPAQAES